MTTETRRWTHPSVIELAGDDDPVTVIADRARALVAGALDQGWEGPPFDPVRLADLLDLPIVAREDVRDARTVPTDDGHLRVEYNPTRPRGRLRYSIAHEIAHTLFPDCAEEVRYRGRHTEFTGDEWQLEALCNIAAAELLMPFGSVAELAKGPLVLDRLLAQQRRFEVSAEALFTRTVHMRSDECAMFCASPFDDVPGSAYRLDYSVGSRTWTRPARDLQRLPATSAVGECTAIGYTAVADEQWLPDGPQWHVQCVGVPPYPGSSLPRVVGLLSPREAVHEDPLVRYVHGDATEPRGDGPKLIAHIVTDAALIWGGGGFAAALRRRWPAAQDGFREWATHRDGRLELGQVHVVRLREDLLVASMIAQHGYGPSRKPRIRYSALRDALAHLAQVALREGASVHMPRIGAGEARGSWDAIEELIASSLSAAGVPVTVYDLPGTRTPGAAQVGLGLESA